MDDSWFNIVCAAFFMTCTVVFFYYLFITIKSYMKCKSETKEELPCPNTCSPGYECKQSDAPADFVIGEVVEEEFSAEAEAEAEPDAMPELIPEAQAVESQEVDAKAAEIPAEI
jgi:hypothetical protein